VRLAGLVARQWSKDDAVLECDGPDRHGCEEFGGGERHAGRVWEQEVLTGASASLSNQVGVISRNQTPPEKICPHRVRSESEGDRARGHRRMLLRSCEGVS
jgi:hypothetical protein